jgi:hypothetical protein
VHENPVSNVATPFIGFPLAPAVGHGVPFVVVVAVLKGYRPLGSKPPALFVLRPGKKEKLNWNG